MFTYSDRDFMSKSMKVVVESIESKLSEPFFSEFKEVAIAAISRSIEAIKAFEASGLHRDLSCFRGNQAEDLINALFCEITDEIVNSEAFQVLDALRHSFVCYAYNGLHQLYTRQENECWHPQIVLTEVLEPNDIDSLPRVLTLYRGCDRSELENRSFGQAWSTSLESAQKFAYAHYLGQDWFDENNRIVLETRYRKDYVLFSDQSIEYEVVVDANKLDGVRKHA
ncbi:hypothetical protein MRY17_11660 [Pseudomonas orientalis]|uniref:hypothetical protein n=1 Tax=Pseudomonas orientalis TaxID=76758 RepID=UPI001FAED575|nr:hypothetical protein [Pseudomonas orientalis]UOB26323.1 hypothetical protein MRY17_11660 [Pseudomonas orientalis]